MGHVQEATFACDTEAEDFADKLEALWKAGCFVNVGNNDKSITVHASSSAMITEAGDIAAGKKPEDKEPAEEEE